MEGSTTPIRRGALSAPRHRFQNPPALHCRWRRRPTSLLAHVCLALDRHVSNVCVCLCVAFREETQIRERKDATVVGCLAFAKVSRRLRWNRPVDLRIAGNLDERFTSFA
jgi:hypothetical protein